MASKVGLPRLLIVDDDPSIRFSMVAVLDEIGFSVRSADNGFAALAEIGREAPDIVLSDLNMPGMSGFEFLGVVRKHFPSIHLIAMSGSFSGTAGRATRNCPGATMDPSKRCDGPVEAYMTSKFCLD